ncbi:MAG: hypothetical protein Tsb0020_30800 [Haliangiales bacterium]
MRAIATGAGSAVSALFALSCLLPACGGPQVPDHDGYRQGVDEPWSSPETLEFNDDREAEVDGELSYPRRRRARWFELTLPGDGEIEVKLSYYPLGALDGTEPDESGRDEPLDLAFEVYDGERRMLVRADNSEDDAGERKKRRTLYELPAGRYLVHLYTQSRLDEVEFTLRVSYRRIGELVSASDFPKTVAFMPTLPQIPTVDDSPPEAHRSAGRSDPPPRRPRNPRRSRPQPPDKEPEAVAEDGMRARIIGIRAGDSGTRITINRGSAHGVVKGWSGRVVSRSGKGISDGGFKITQVKAQESYATVRATPDAVTAAANVIIKP